MLEVLSQVPFDLLASLLWKTNIDKKGWREVPVSQGTEVKSLRGFIRTGTSVSTLF